MQELLLNKISLTNNFIIKNYKKNQVNSNKIKKKI